MKIYGYTKCCSEGNMCGRESATKLFASEKERNAAMYKSYSDAFDSLESEGKLNRTDKGAAIDANGETKMPEAEFMKELKNVNIECDCFGLIQTDSCHVQFEPFSQNI